ncbi:MAG: YeeE/YedE family protein [Alphaproteobacteria bacterium]|nr:YeeE/YedE family protein [Alphaproteobacteria bacterium]
MAPFDPLLALLGGALIGVASVLLMMLTGRIAGISGILGGLLAPGAKDKAWRIAFVVGLIAAPLIFAAMGRSLAVPDMPASWLVVAAAGLLVGFGTRLGSGCTSGHGVCGIARLSPRSIVATAIFMVAAVATVAIMRHGLGG